MGSLLPAVVVCMVYRLSKHKIDENLTYCHGPKVEYAVQCSDTVDCLMPKWGPNRAPRSAEADFPFRSVNHSRRWGQQGKAPRRLLFCHDSHRNQPLRVECAIIALFDCMFARHTLQQLREMTMGRCANNASHYLYVLSRLYPGDGQICETGTWQYRAVLQ